MLREPPSSGLPFPDLPVSVFPFSDSPVPSNKKARLLPLRPFPSSIRRNTPPEPPPARQADGRDSIRTKVFERGGMGVWGKGGENFPQKVLPCLPPVFSRPNPRSNKFWLSKRLFFSVCFFLSRSGRQESRQLFPPERRTLWIRQRFFLFTIQLFALQRSPSWKCSPSCLSLVPLCSFPSSSVLMEFASTTRERLMMRTEKSPGQPMSGVFCRHRIGKKGTWKDKARHGGRPPDAIRKEAPRARGLGSETAERAGAARKLARKHFPFCARLV